MKLFLRVVITFVFICAIYLGWTYSIELGQQPNTGLDLLYLALQGVTIYALIFGVWLVWASHLTSIAERVNKWFDRHE